MPNKDEFEYVFVYFKGSYVLGMKVMDDFLRYGEFIEHQDTKVYAVKIVDFV
jgi:hypothetical protein